MNPDIETLLKNVPPHNAPPDLRGRVLRAVEVELGRAPIPRAWLSRSDVRAAFCVSAALLVGVLLNAWAVRSDEARQARLCGVRPLPRAMRDAIEMAESAAGPTGKEFVRRQAVAAWQARLRAQAWDIGCYEQQLRRIVLAVLAEERSFHVQEDSEVDADRPGRDARSALDRQRDFRVA